MKIVDKQSDTEALDECKIIDKQQREKIELSSNEETIDRREETSVETSSEKANVLGSLEKIATEKNNLDNAKKIDVRQKSLDDKVNSSLKPHLMIEEKRKSAPVKIEGSEDWMKPVFNKQSSLEENSRYLFIYLY